MNFYSHLNTLEYYIYMTCVFIPACSELNIPQCSNGLCIFPNQFCDGTDDCGDASDEADGCGRFMHCLINSLLV